MYEDGWVGREPGARPGPSPAVNKYNPLGGIVFSLLVTVSVVRSDSRLAGDEEGDSADCHYPISFEGLHCHEVQARCRERKDFAIRNSCI